MAILSTLPPNLQPARGAHASTRLDAPAALRFWHLTSLDAPTVAVVWTLVFAWAVPVPLPIWVVTVVALSCWCFYISDRLLDARQANTPLRARHHFHWKHRRSLLPLAIAAAAVTLGLVVRSMPYAARERDSVLAAAALVYFTSVHSPWRIAAPRFRFPKELLVGILFTFACAAPTLTRIAGSRVRHPLGLLPLLLVFITLAWLNCHAIESWESASPAWPSVFFLAALLAAFTLPAAILAAVSQGWRQAAVLATGALSAVLLGLLDRNRQKLTPIALRVCADLVLLAPAILLFLPKGHTA